MRQILKSYLYITLGTILLAVGIYFFKFPNNFSTGGVSGIATILGALFPGITKGNYVLIINCVLLVVGLLSFGRHFAIKTVYSSLLLSAVVAGLEIICPMAASLTNQKFLELIFSIILTGAGSALLFQEGASSGGTDIVAMILKKHTSLDIGKALFCSDFAITIIAGLVFGIETGLYSMIGLLIKAFLVDNIIEGINLSKCFLIITEEPENVCSYIMKELHRGATIVHSNGAFSNRGKGLIITVLNRKQAVHLKAYVKTVDAQGFSIILNSSDIVGKGFHTV